MKRSSRPLWKMGAQTGPLVRVATCARVVASTESDFAAWDE